MSKRRVVVITDEGKSFRFQSGLAGDIFGGSFISVLGLTQTLRSEGFPVTLHIVSTRYGLIGEKRRIMKYAVDERKLLTHDFASELLPQIHGLLVRNCVLVLALSTPYALAISTAVDSLPSSSKQPAGLKVFAISGRKGINALKEAFRRLSVDIEGFERPGVARITSRARMAIIRALTIKRNDDGPHFSAP